MSVLGSVTCRLRGECVEGQVHRLDVDLELCVCARCGAGWVRDVSPWQRLEESFQRMKATVDRLCTAADRLRDSLAKFARAVERGPA